MSWLMYKGSIWADGIRRVPKYTTETPVLNGRKFHSVQWFMAFNLRSWSRSQVRIEY